MFLTSMGCFSNGFVLGKYQPFISSLIGFSLLQYFFFFFFWEQKVLQLLVSFRHLCSIGTIFSSHG